MLKLTNSFCRYLNVTCKNINIKVHVRTFTHFSGTRDKSYREILQRTTSAFSFRCLRHQIRFYANTKKKSRFKKTFQYLNETKNKQMSESYQPTLNHVSTGGEFLLSSESDNSEDKSMCKHFVDSKHKSKYRPISSDFRIWESVGKKSENGVFRFTVVSYNVLAQCLLEFHPYLYRRAYPENLKWKIRGSRLYEEIVNLAPDILCLQEVQASHINNFYNKFEEIGYCGVYKQKTGRKFDGCAIYFKKSLFQIQDKVSVEFYQPQIPILNRDNIGIMVKLVPNASPSTPIVIATTHLLFHPQRTDVRLAQMQVLLAEIDRFAFHKNNRGSGYYPVILTGDFNSQPESAVVQLLDRGRINASGLRDNSDWQTIGVTDNCQHLTAYVNRQNAQTTDFSMTKIYNSDYCNAYPNMSNAETDVGAYEALFNSGIISHSLQLTSVYDKVKQDGQKEATTVQDYWVTVDYIYFSAHALRVVDRLRLPTALECNVLGALPNHVYASDHLALAAVFELNVKASL